MRINVEGKALTDPRFKALALELGITWFEAMGRCLAVWALAYERRAATLPDRHIDAAAELRGFARAMVTAELAGDVPGGVRMAGVTEGVQWLLLQDAKRQKALAAKRRAAGMVEDVPERSADVPGDVPFDVPISPALALDPTLERALARPPARARSSHPEPDTRRPPEPSPGAIAQAPTLAISAPIAQAPVARMGAAPAAGWTKLAHDAWTHGATVYRELLAEGVDASANPDAWNGLPRPIVSDRTREMREAGLTVEQAWRRIVGAFATAKANARAKRTLRWLVPSRFFAPSSFDLDADATPAQVAKPPPTRRDEFPADKAIAIGTPRAPGDDEPRFPAHDVAAFDAAMARPRMTPEERAARLAALVAAEEAS